MVDDIGLAVYEALANVIEHAYPAGAAHPVFDLHVQCEVDMLTVVVADHGRWKPADPTLVPMRRPRRHWRGCRSW